LAQAVATLEQTHGAGHDAGHGHAEHPPTSTGIDHRKMLMWAFLASDCMFFGSLIATYLIYRGRAEELVVVGQGKGPLPHEVLDIPYTSVSAFVLLMSSLTMVLALAAIQRGDVGRSRVWLLATALLGMAFLGGQVYEFTTFVREGLTLKTNVFGTSFYVLTGFHGTHVAVGVLMLLTLFTLSFAGKITQDSAMTVELVGLYWHFVDIVWIVIFTVVYLIPTNPGPGG
jgi:heme/copper-type cytochrome/quinol oxidase subunit 3